MDYLPEWKLYLWKKLLLNKEGFDRGTVIAHNFMFFSDDDQIQLMAKKAYGVAQQQRTGGKVDLSNYTSVDDDYYGYHPLKILSALIELMDSRPRVLTIAATLNKQYITRYRQAKNAYETQQRKISLASISMGHGTPYKPNPSYLNDPFCDLGESIYKKTEKGEALTSDEFRRLSGIAYSGTHDLLSLKLKINKAALRAKLDEYIDNFMESNLVAKHNVRYYAPSTQRLGIYSAIQATTGEYGPKNRQLTMDEVCKYAGWSQGEERHYRFFETMFSFERTNNIIIDDIRKGEVVFSLVTHDDATTDGNATQQSSDDAISVQLKSGLLTLNKTTGAFRLNDVEGTLNPTGREFKILLKLITAKNHQVKYDDLVDSPISKPGKRNLVFELRNLKTSLGILPSKHRRNADIFDNIKNFGYRLII